MEINVTQSRYAYEVFLIQYQAILGHLHWNRLGFSNTDIRYKCFMRPCNVPPDLAKNMLLATGHNRWHEFFCSGYKQATQWSIFCS